MAVGGSPTKSESPLPALLRALRPVAFRLAHMPDPRARAVIEGAARAANWEPRASPRPSQTGEIRRGRGIAYIRYDNVRTYAAAVMAVEVNTRTGVIRVTDCWAAQDCGQVINPANLPLLQSTATYILLLTVPYFYPRIL